MGNRLGEAVLTSTHNLCFEQKNNNVYPCKSQFFYIKVGFKEGGGVKIIQACFHDVAVWWLAARFVFMLSCSLSYRCVKWLLSIIVITLLGKKELVTMLYYIFSSDLLRFPSEL